jgi:glycosyltransferase involved in cell wall biosynthesis
MKTLMITSSYPKFPGDATAPFIESIARGLAARGHAVDVVLPHHPELRRAADEPVRFFPYRYAPSDAWCRWGYAQSLEADVRVRREIYLLLPFVAVALRGLVAERLRAERYDVVHVHWVVPNAVLVADVVHAHGLPLVVSLHGSDVFLAERLRPARGLAGRVFAGAGAVTACSRDLLDRALRLGSPPARSRVVPYGVDVEAFSPHATTGDAAGRLSTAPGRALVVAVGRLVEKKGFRDLLTAAANTQGIEVAIAGEGDLRGALEAQARAAGTPVRFLGKLDRAGVAHVLAAADVVAVPSVVDDAGNVDGLPNVLLEALAAGRAVVATRVAGIPDVVEDGVNGLLVPERDPAALAAALARLAREPETRARLGAAARQGAVERLGWNAAARAFEECYAQAAALDAA